MPLYDDPLKMFLDIRTHVFQHGHTVVASDLVVSRALGYICMGCLNGVDCSPQTETWHVSIAALKDMGSATVFGISVPGLLKDRAKRDQLTRYLNGFRGDFDIPLPPVVDRYHRPWVI